MTPSWDLFIIILFILIAAFGLILGRGKVLNVLIGSYVGYVAATEAGFFVHDLVAGYSQTATVSLFTVKAIIFFLTIVILNTKTEFAGKGSDDGSSIVTILYGILAGGLMTTILLSFMEEAQRKGIMSSSAFISQIESIHFIWIVAPIIVLIFADFLKGKLAK